MSPPLRVEILAQGDEVVTGQTVDTNSAWLAEELTALGFVVTRHLTVGDHLDHLRALFVEASARAELVICTGGLGPTEDDLTAEAAALAFSAPLQLDEVALEAIEAMYARFRRPMPEVNRKQAWLPTGATRLDNAYGTAPGFAVPTALGLLVCMPGVPSEMRGMFREQVLPLLGARFQVRAGRLVTLRTTGLGESNLQERIGPFSHPEIALGYRTMLGENQIKLRAPGPVSEAELSRLAAELHQRIGSAVFSIEGLGGPGGSLAEVLGRLLVERAHTLAVAESCTGGQVAALCTAVAGSSDWFHEGCVTYANEAKQRRLGVPAELIAAHGAVSEQVARAMAEGMRASAGTTYGLASTGVAGPTGGSALKPVGTVHIALAGPNGTEHRELHLGGGRSRIQALAAHAVIDLLRRHLQGLLSP
jgi:nicotinamide-nucleotide amidase